MLAEAFVSGVGTAAPSNGASPVTSPVTAVDLHPAAGCAAGCAGGACADVAAARSAAAAAGWAAAAGEGDGVLCLGAVPLWPAAAAAAAGFDRPFAGAWVTVTRCARERPARLRAAARVETGRRP